MNKTELTPHQKETCERLSPTGRKLFGLIEFDDNEELLLEVRKVPFGLFLILLTGLFFISVIFIVAFLLNSSLSDGLLGTEGGYGMAIFGGAAVLGGLVGLGLLLAAIVYINDVIFVTSEKLAQVLYRNVITRKVSQLNIGDVQDVTVTQKGIFARIFNYGTLVIETAGEQDNYIFTYIPNPTHVCQSIIGAHEEYVSRYGN